MDTLQKYDPDTDLAPVAKTETAVAVASQSTPQQLRVLEVNEALLPAFQKASTLEISEEEAVKLTAPFMDSDVEIRPNDGLIYLPHIFISDRLNQVFRPGQWSLICRRHWIEAGVMFGEYVLLIRGCYVGESVGGHPYQPDNKKINYSDTLESTAAEALRRIAGKRLSCGSQVWYPDYARKWTAAHSETYQDKNWKGQTVTLWRRKFGGAAVGGPGNSVAGRMPASDRAAQSSPGTLDAPLDRKAEGSGGSGSAPVSPVAKVATAETLKWFIAQCESMREPVENYLRHTAKLLPTEPLEELGLKDVPTSKAAFMEFTGKVDEWIRNQQPEGGVAAQEDDSWRAFLMPFGKNTGIKLEDLEKPYLFGLWANHEVEEEYNGKPKKPETIAKDREFRRMLDLAGIHYQFTKD